MQTGQYPKPEKSFLDALKLYRDDLKLSFQKQIERYTICHVDKRNGLTRVVRIIEQEDGQFRLPDIRDINYCKEYVMFDVLDKYPDPADMYFWYKNLKEKKEKEAKKKRSDFIKDFIKDNKKRWQIAIEKAKSGILHDPTAPENKISTPIYSIPKKVKVENGYKQSANGLLIPTNYEDKYGRK